MQQDKGDITKFRMSTKVDISWIEMGYNITILCIKKICKSIADQKFTTVIYMRVLFLRLTNILLRVFGYTRVYDIQNGKDITLFYYVLRSVLKLNLPIVVDFAYPILGVCTYDHDRYIRYICYNEKLSKIESKKYRISQNNYNSIKKIELLDYNGSDNTKIDAIDVTDAKYNFYDIEHFTDPYDMIRFYRIHNGDLLLNPDTTNGTTKTVLFTREDFDDSLLETVTTYEEICRQEVSPLG
jgi:hypothetical protein